ncbi:hypothetical protein V2H45_06150 [Tumidithrix elongata RA019]|uniref:Uncharacterized protein n=1 Tax=Tumidithrix elongata BACA0141 TaxID=2716417 RepID=A0AAW9PRM9_9CYAN|nr:hypothetical protein [Tumidithrix elongata RA019]
MKAEEVLSLLRQYIGLSEDFVLGDFTPQTLTEFYLEYCGFEVEHFFYRYQGSPYIEENVYRRFIAILLRSSPDRKAKIIRGVLERFPLDAPSRPKTRTKELYAELLSIAEDLEGSLVR